MTDRIREGVTASVNAAMNAVNADVCREDGILFRTCEHGIRHPVGNLNGALTDEPKWLSRNHHRVGDPSWTYAPAVCCVEACCADWPKSE